MSNAFFVWHLQGLCYDRRHQGGLGTPRVDELVCVWGMHHCSTENSYKESHSLLPGVAYLKMTMEQMRSVVNITVRSRVALTQA